MIKVYVNARCIGFGAPGRYVATLSMLDAQLTILKPCSEDDLWDVKWLAKNFIIGTVFKFRSGDPVVLGRPLATPQMAAYHGVPLLEVDLSAPGNPDKQQYAPIAEPCRARGVSIPDIIASCEAYRDQHELGGGNWGKATGCVFEVREGKPRKPLGRVNYSGRYQTLAEIKAFEAEMKLKYPR